MIICCGPVATEPTTNSRKEAERSTSVVSGGAVIHEDELVDWSVVSVSPNRITFKNGWGDIWHYDRCR